MMITPLLTFILHDLKISVQFIVAYPGNKTTYKYNLFGILEGQKREGEEFRTDGLPAPLPLDILLPDLEEELLPTGKLCLQEERDCIGRPIRRTYPGGITATCSYTSSGMPAHLSYQDNRGELDTFHYTYDGENCLIGIRAWRREIPEESSVYTYKYDALSRLTEVFKNGTLQRRYTYDARGNRTVLLTREGKETYSYDSGDRLQERTVTSFQNQSIVKTYRYRYDEIGSMYEEGENLTKEKEMETQIPVSSLGAEELVLTDHLGSPLRRIDGRGKITGSYAYDEFGRLLYREGQMPEKGYGGYRAREDGTLQAGIRVYDPQLGRFHSPDPVSAPPEEPWNNNPYVYVWNNPLTHVDRTGAYGKSISGLPAYVTGNGSQSTAMPYPAAVQDPNGEAAKMYRGQAVSGCRKSFTEQLYYEIEEYSSHGITSGLFQEGIPLLSSIDQFLRGVGIGLFKGLYEMITGIIQLPATLLQLGINITVNPLETIEAMGKGTWYGVKQAIFEDFIYGDASSRGERVGRLIPDIVLLLAGVGKINAAKNISRGAETAEDAAKIAGFADDGVDATKMKGVIEGNVDSPKVKIKPKIKPSNLPDVNVKPRGSRTSISKNADDATRRSLIRENESADTIAKNGYDIEQNPKVEETTRNPDYRIENEIFDCYSPAGQTSTRNIASTISEKVIKKGQTKRVVLNLDDWKGVTSDVKKQLIEYPIEGLEEVLIVRDGLVLSIYP